MNPKLRKATETLAKDIGGAVLDFAEALGSDSSEAMPIVLGVAAGMAYSMGYDAKLFGEYASKMFNEALNLQEKS